MALFSRNKDAKESDKTTAKDTKEVSTARPTDRDLSSVLIKPRITEKAVGQSEQNVYTFVVRRDATKHDVRDAVKAAFGVTPVKVNIVNKQPRQHMSRRIGKKITEKGRKKAYVYLKKGDTINLV